MMVCFPATFFGKVAMFDIRKELNEETCYIKPTLINGILLQAVHIYDGNLLALCHTRDLAFCIARQLGFKPMSLH